MKNNKINRRDFILKSAMATAATSLMAGTVSCSSTDRTLNLAIIGAGTQGRVLLGDCLKLEGVRFRAVCDIWSFSQRYASNTLKKYDQEVNVYEDYRKMLEAEKELDAVIIATPDFMHAEQSIACMEAGLDVYCEKEMAHNLKSSRSMAEAVRRTRRLLQIGHQRRSNPVYRLALEALKEDQLAGRITNSFAQWNKTVQPFLTWPKKYEIPPETLKKYHYDSMEQFRNWRWFRKYGGGPVSDNGSHQIDIFSWFLGSNPKEILAMGGSDYYREREWYGDVMAILEYPFDRGPESNTVRASYQVMNTNGFGGFFERYFGDQGTLTISEFNQQCSFTPEPAAELPEWAEGMEPERTGNTLAYPLLPLLSKKSEAAAAIIEECRDRTTYMWHLDNFFNAIRKNDSKLLNCPADEAYKTAVAVFGINEAIQSGNRLSLTSDEFKV